MEQLEPAPVDVSFTPYDRPVRAAFVGLGRIYDLNVRAYVDNPDVEVVALVDPSEERRARAPGATGPTRRPSRRPPSSRRAGSRSTRSRRCSRSRCTSTAWSSCSATAGTSTCRSRCATTSPTRRRMLDAARANDRVLRVMENYLFYEPLRKLKADGGVGRARRRRGYHLKMVASGRGGWDVPMSSYEWQFQQMQHRARDPRVRRRVAQARHRALALRPDRGGAGMDRRHRGRARRRRSTRRRRSCGSTTTGSAACGTSRSRPTCTCAPTTTRTTSAGRSPAARATRGSTAAPAAASSSRASRSTPTARCAAYHALDDDWASSFRDSGRHWLRWLHTGEGPLLVER